jgi:CubicO group peptidase (beta-lactamase class C family)
LDDPVEAYIPELRHLANRAPGNRPITFRDLASHTAGLAREPAQSHAARGPYRDWRRKLITSIASTDAVAAPGEGYLYSNMGYSLLGLALERVADVPYEVLVRTLVAEPLGMERSHLALPGEERDRLATGYVNMPGDTIDPRVPRAEHRGRGYQVPGAGVYSTVGDLARLVMAMTGALGDVPVTAASRATALTDHTLTDHTVPRQTGAPPVVAATDSPTQVARTGYGLGFQLHRIGGTTIAGHSGSIAGYSAYLAFDPETRVGVVLLRNYNHGMTNLGAMAARLVMELGEGRRGL